MIIIGIDPGLSGAVASRRSNITSVDDMPRYTYSETGYVKNAVDLHALARMLREITDGLPAAVFMERVNAMPGQGVASMFSLGMSYWGAAGVVAGLGLPLYLVRPATWKAHFKLTREKGQALQLARRLFPAIDLSRKKDHNRAEALLIAHYGMAILNGVKGE